MNEQSREPDLEAAGADASAIMALVEGEAVEPEVRERLERALARDADLRQWVEALRADRALVRAWVAEGDSDAPAGLVEDALALAERDALTGAHRMPRQRRVFAARGLALAAVFAVAAVASVFFWQSSNQQPTPVGAPRAQSTDEREQRTALPSDAENAPALAQGTPSQASAPAEKSADALADASTESQADVADTTRARAAASEASVVFPADASGAEIAARDDPTARTQTANILHLAREGRLALLVRAARPAEFVAAFVDIVRQAEPGLRFHAHVGAANAAEGFGAPAATLGELTLPADAAAIEALRVMFTQIGANEARFLERDAPLSLPMDAQGAGPAWWRAPASRWTPRVVVELRLEASSPPAP